MNSPSVENCVSPSLTSPTPVEGSTAPETNSSPWPSSPNTNSPLETTEIPETVDTPEPPKKTRWEIWGRWRNDPECVVAVIEPTEDRNIRLQIETEEFGPETGWRIWLESRPVEHPHRALQRRLESYHAKGRCPDFAKIERPDE